MTLCATDAVVVPGRLARADAVSDIAGAGQRRSDAIAIVQRGPFGNCERSNAHNTCQSQIIPAPIIIY